MLSRSSTREPLAASLSPSSSDDKCDTHLRPLPFPAMSRTSTRGSSASYSSTMPLNPNHEPSKARRSVAQKLFSGWNRGAEGASDREAQHPTGQSPYDKGGGTGAGPPSLRWWQGWRVILFDSCKRSPPCNAYTTSFKSGLNIMILLIPVAVSGGSMLHIDACTNFGVPRVSSRCPWRSLSNSFSQVGIYDRDCSHVRGTLIYAQRACLL